MSDRIIIMNKGVIEQIGTPQEIYNHPASVFVADFIGRSNFLECTVAGAKNGVTIVNMYGKQVEINDNGWQRRKNGDKVTVMARPESVLLGEEGIFETAITSSIFMGNMQEYITQTGDLQIIIEDHDFAVHAVYGEGETKYVSFKPGSLHII